MTKAPVTVLVAEPARGSHLSSESFCEASWSQLAIGSLIRKQVASPPWRLAYGTLPSPAALASTDDTGGSSAVEPGHRGRNSPTSNEARALRPPPTPAPKGEKRASSTSRWPLSRVHKWRPGAGANLRSGTCSLGRNDDVHAFVAQPGHIIR